MEYLAGVASLFSGLWFCWALARSMRANERPIWLCLLGCALVFPLGAVGAGGLLGGLAGDAGPNGDPMGLSDAVIGLFVLGLAWLPVFISRRGDGQGGPKASPGRAAESGGNLRFLYKDAEGRKTKRTVSQWNYDGRYIRGFCETAGDMRTFRRDRAIKFYAGESLLAQAEASRKALARLEIMFTGFAAADRSALEQDATAYGMLVRKGVTKNLDFVCAGPNAGPAKLSQARQQGIAVLDQDQFYDLAENGVLP